MADIVKGAALQFTEDELGGPCVEQETFVNVSGVVSNLINGNGDRVGLIFINAGLNDVQIGFATSSGGILGIRLAAQGGSASMTVRDDFTLPTRNWQVTTTGGTSIVYVLEIIRFTALKLGGS